MSKKTKKPNNKQKDNRIYDKISLGKAIFQSLLIIAIATIVLLLVLMYRSYSEERKFIKLSDDMSELQGTLNDDLPTEKGWRRYEECTQPNTVFPNDTYYCDASVLSRFKTENKQDMKDKIDMFYRLVDESDLFDPLVSQEKKYPEYSLSEVDDTQDQRKSYGAQKFIHKKTKMKCVSNSTLFDERKVNYLSQDLVCGDQASGSLYVLSE